MPVLRSKDHVSNLNQPNSAGPDSDREALTNPKQRQAVAHEQSAPGQTLAAQTQFGKLQPQTLHSEI
jgi:hypothetical protein